VSALAFDQEALGDDRCQHLVSDHQPLRVAAADLVGVAVLEDREQAEREAPVVGRQVVVATGSSARALPGVPFDEERVLSNDGALRIGAVPRTLGLIGSGVIGLEMGSVWRRLGAQVTVLEALPTFLGAVDEQIAKEAHKVFTKQGLVIELGVQLDTVKTTRKGVSVAYRNAKGEAQTLDVDKLIVSIGRVPNTEGLNAQAVGLKLDGRGAIEVDDQCRTNLPGVWAVGDVVRGPMLAHKAEDEGIAVAENIAGETGIVNHDVIPSVVYTWPEIAGVGLTTEQAIEKAGGDKAKVKVGKFPMMANSRAKTNHEPDGFVKVIADAETDRVLGVWCIASVAGTMIAEAGIAMEFGATSEDIAYTCHAHPTHAEAMKEAAMAVQGKPIHI
jgi:dihydrolipoamide dehydrogenase